jgi:FkbM family methyltransferase
MVAKGHRIAQFSGDQSPLMNDEFFSQYGEDSWIVSNLRPRRGVFVEVGAYDGISFSNTLYFEQHGWTGLCIEPDPTSASLCTLNRSAITMCCAVDSKPGIRPFYTNTEDRALSGLNRRGRPILVSVHRLEEILQKARLKKIDLLSIDTEGTELSVWNSIGVMRPGIVIMEYYTLGKPSNHRRITEKMALDGYHERHRTTSNIIFTR